MPEWLHRKLAARARKLGLTGDRFNAYVYGTLNKYEKLHKTASAIKKRAEKKRSKK